MRREYISLHDIYKQPNWRHNRTLEIGQPHVNSQSSTRARPAAPRFPRYSAAPGGRRNPPAPALERPGDFTAGRRLLWLSAAAVPLGALSAIVAWALLRLIGVFTNLFFYQRWGSALVSPAANRLGILVVLVPIAGALIVGFMARYGSERIRGHGIPEAIESILVQGSSIEPRLAILKPVSAAISIGSGGPFGAEGPIIMTGGAFGSLCAQVMRLTSAERKTLLVAGAAGGMSATFASPVAATLLAVELLLFEWKPRSMVPVAVASGAAAAARRYILGPGPLFPVPPHPIVIGPAGLLGCVLIGLLAGGLSALLTVSVYAAEDAFRKLPIHWMWWPALGAIVVGVGGFFFPQALGVGYDMIRVLVAGPLPVHLLWGILLVKWLIWAVALGSGTSGGVVAPLLLIGGALGGLAATFLPNEGLGFWPLIGMAAVLGGTMRVPLTGVVFALELTHDAGALLPLLLAVTIAYGVTVLTLRRSILTEKVSRHGYHLRCEYEVDPLETLLVRDVMQTNFLAFPSSAPLKTLFSLLTGKTRSQRLYPVLNADERMMGVVTGSDAENWEHDPLVDKHQPVSDLARSNPITACPDEPLRVVANRMAETGVTRLPVVERRDPGRVIGLLCLKDLMIARARSLNEEQHRERVIPLRIFHLS
jgi:H+/Cl- antiporter ClcA/CBS domain-containing protein